MTQVSYGPPPPAKPGGTFWRIANGGNPRMAGGHTSIYGWTSHADGQGRPP